VVVPAFDGRGFLPPFLGADATTHSRSPYEATMSELVAALGPLPYAKICFLAFLSIECFSVRSVSLSPRSVNAVKKIIKTLNEADAEIKIVGADGEVRLDREKIASLNIRLNELEVFEDREEMKGYYWVFCLTVSNTNSRSVMMDRSYLVLCPRI
jgi:hypothetical protein